MKTSKLTWHGMICFIASVMLISGTAEAQRMRHGGGGSQRSRPAASKSTPQRNSSINGGHQKSGNRDYSQTRSDQATARDNKATSGKDNKASNVKDNKATGGKDNKASNVKDNKTTNVKDNKVNIDNSDTNINVNVDRSRDVNVSNRHNTVVRPPVRPYPRPPYVYGGRSFYCYHPYRYHPYHPYYYGPSWHPWGFFVAALAVTAIVVSVNNQQYHYDQGTYYVESNGGYTAVQAPVGATITTLPEGSQTVVVNETTNNYYYGGTYYEKTDQGYTVVPPTAGTVVESLPEGGEEVKIGDVTYVKYGETYYQPIEKDGKNMYEVVNIEESKG